VADGTNNGYNWILVCIDVFSKFVFSKLSILAKSPKREKTEHVLSSRLLIPLKYPSSDNCVNFVEFLTDLRFTYSFF
jgi:hypothetical protein